MSDGAVYAQAKSLPSAYRRSKLRGLARAAGHELEHIVTVARQYLERGRVTGNRAYRYLECMAAKPAQLVGYQARARQIERLAASAVGAA